VIPALGEEVSTGPVARRPGRADDAPRDHRPHVDPNHHSRNPRVSRSGRCPPVPPQSCAALRPRAARLPPPGMWRERATMCSAVPRVGGLLRARVPVGVPDSQEPMGAAIAACSARSRRWASRSASVKGLVVGAEGGRGAGGGGGGVSGWVRTVAGCTAGSRSATLSNQRSPGGGSCEARDEFSSCASRDPWARSAMSPATIAIPRTPPTTYSTRRLSRTTDTRGASAAPAREARDPLALGSLGVGLASDRDAVLVAACADDQDRALDSRSTT
jgi:hypothetical protein